MATLASDLIAETRQHFLGPIRELKNKLAANLTASTSSTTVQVTYELGAIAAGHVLTIGLERMLVWSAASTTSIIVERGYDGTTVAAHTAGDLVAVDSRCDDFAIFRALNNELASLSSPNKGLFRVRTGFLTFNPSTFGYDLNGFGTIIGAPLSVYAEETGTGDWTPLGQATWVYDAAADTTDFPSGRSLALTAGSPGLRIKVVYRAPFVALAALTTDVNATAFFPSTANDILPMGAALQLATGRPMARSDMNAQGSSRRSEETSTQDTLIAVSGLRARYDERVQDEALRLSAEHPQAI